MHTHGVWAYTQWRRTLPAVLHGGSRIPLGGRPAPPPRRHPVSPAAARPARGFATPWTPVRRYGVFDGRLLPRAALVALGCLLTLIPGSLVVAVAASGGGDAAVERDRAERQARREARREQRAVDRALATTGLVTEVDTRRREIALTFDDGPGADTPEVLDILAREQVPATFFVVGRAVDEHPDLVRRAQRDGHVIANHTTSHSDMSALGPDDQAAEIDATTERLDELGIEARLFRPPMGLYDDTTLALSSDRGQLPVLWSIDTGDYMRPGANAIADSVTSGAEPGAIALLHDGGGDRSQTVAALPRIIRELRADGYRFVTVPKLLTHGDPVG